MPRECRGITESEWMRFDCAEGHCFQRSKIPRSAWGDAVGLVQEVDDEGQCPVERAGIARCGGQLAQVVAVVSGHDEQAGVRDEGGEEHRVLGAVSWSADTISAGAMIEATRSSDQSVKPVSISSRSRWNIRSAWA